MGNITISGNGLFIKKTIAAFLAVVFLFSYHLSWASEDGRLLRDNASSSGQAGKDKLSPPLGSKSEEFKARFSAGEVLLSHKKNNEYIGKRIAEIGYDKLLKASVPIAGVEGEVKLIAIPGLLKFTGLPAHLGLGRYYGKPVIYIDSDLYYNEEIRQHEYDEVSRWEALRGLLEIGPEEMRKWVMDNISTPVDDERLPPKYRGKTSRQIAESIHQECCPVGHLYAQLANAVDFEYLANLTAYDENEGYQEDITIAAQAPKRQGRLTGMKALLVSSAVGLQTMAAPVQDTGNQGTIQSMPNGDDSARTKAAQVVVRSRQESLADILNSDSDPGAKARAAMELVRMGDEKAVEPICRLYLDYGKASEQTVAKIQMGYCMKKLCEKYPKQAAYYLAGNFKSGEHSFDGDLARALFIIGKAADDKKTIEFVIQQTQKPDFKTNRDRGWIASMLGETKDPRIFELLVLLSGDPDVNIQYQVIGGLMFFEDARAVPCLLSMLTNSKDSAVRKRIIEVLTGIEDEKTLKMLVTPLLDILSGKPEGTSGDIIIFFGAKNIPDPRIGPAILKYLSEEYENKGGDKGAILEAIYALGVLRERAALDVLKRLSSEPTYKLTAMHALSNMADESAVDYFVDALLTAKDPYSSYLAGEAIIKIGPRAIHKLTVMLRTPNDLERFARLLFRGGSPGTIDATIEGALEDNSNFYLKVLSSGSTAGSSDVIIEYFNEQKKSGKILSPEREKLLDLLLQAQKLKITCPLRWVQSFPDTSLLEEMIKNRNSTSPDDRPVALVVYPTADWNGGFTFMPQYDAMKELVKHGYRIMYYEATTRKDMITALLSGANTSKSGKVRVIFLAGHGSSNRLSFGTGDPRYEPVLDMDRVLSASELDDTIKADIGKILEDKRGQVILISCSVGEGGAQDPENLVNTLRKKVFPNAEGVYGPMKPANLRRLIIDEKQEIKPEFWNYEEKTPVDTYQGSLENDDSDVISSVADIHSAGADSLLREAQADIRDIKKAISEGDLKSARSEAAFTYQVVLELWNRGRDESGVPGRALPRETVDGLLGVVYELEGEISRAEEAEIVANRAESLAAKARVKGSPAECLETIRQNPDLMTNALNKEIGIKVSDVAKLRPYHLQTVYKEFKTLRSLGILISVEGRRGYYRFSDMMIGPDANYTKTLINAINDIQYQVGKSGEERPLQRWGIADDRIGLTSELIKTAILHQINIMQRPAIPEGKVLWHILEEDVISVSQRSSFAQKINKASERSKASERIYILKKGESIEDAVNQISAAHQDAVFDVALSDESHIENAPGDIKRLVFKGPAGDVSQIEGIVAALRALHGSREDVIPTLKQIYAVLGGVACQYDIPLEVIDDPVKFARSFIFNLPPAVPMPISEIPKLNERILQLLIAA